MTPINETVHVPHDHKVNLHGTIALIREAIDTIEEASVTGLTPQTFMDLGLEVLQLIQPLFAGNPTIAALIQQAIDFLTKAGG